MHQRGLGMVIHSETIALTPDNASVIFSFQIETAWCVLFVLASQAKHQPNEIRDKENIIRSRPTCETRVQQRRIVELVGDGKKLQGEPPIKGHPRRCWSRRRQISHVEHSREQVPKEEFLLAIGWICPFFDNEDAVVVWISPPLMDHAPLYGDQAIRRGPALSLRSQRDKRSPILDAQIFCVGFVPMWFTGPVRSGRDGDGSDMALGPEEKAFVASGRWRVCKCVVTVRDMMEVMRYGAAALLGQCYLLCARISDFWISDHLKLSVNG